MYFNASKVKTKKDALLHERYINNLKRHRSGKWSPSSFGSCFRKQFWYRKNTPITDLPNARILSIMEIGKLIHKFYQDLLFNESTEVLCETEDIKGYADIVTTDTVIDIKSQASDAFRYMDQKNFNCIKEKYNYWLQLTYYATYLKKPKIELIFVGRDYMRERVYSYTTDMLKENLNVEINILREYWNKDELPPANPRLYNGKECQYCPYKSLCNDTNNKKEK